MRCSCLYKKLKLKWFTMMGCWLRPKSSLDIWPGPEVLINYREYGWGVLKMYVTEGGTQNQVSPMGLRACIPFSVIVIQARWEASTHLRGKRKVTNTAKKHWPRGGSGPNWGGPRWLHASMCPGDPQEWNFVKISLPKGPSFLSFPIKTGFSGSSLEKCMFKNLSHY